MNKKIIFTITAAILVVGSVFTQAANAKEPRSNSTYNSKELMSLDSFPSWFKDAMERETKVKKKSKFKLEEFNVNKKIAGKVKLIQEEEGYRYYNIDIGTDSPVECHVFKEFDGPANSLYSIIDNLLIEGLVTLNEKPLSSRQNYAIGSGVVAGTPYLLLDTLYILGEADKQVSGVLKGLTAETDQSLQVCIHNELGYRETFFSVFESFIEAMTENEENPEFLESILYVSFNDIPAGYTREKYATDDDGDIQITIDSSLIIPVDANSVSRLDSKSTSWSSVDGSLINESVYSIENSVLSSNLSLNFKDEQWHVEGQLQGKDVKYELAHTGWLLSSYGNYGVTEKLGKSEDDSADYMMWLHDADPSSALNVVFSKIFDNPNANYNLNMGPLKMQFMADERGIFKKGSIEQGPVSINLKQVFLKGQPLP